jgi:hypothetical protein
VAESFFATLKREMENIGSRPSPEFKLWIEHHAGAGVLCPTIFSQPILDLGFDFFRNLFLSSTAVTVEDIQCVGVGSEITSDELVSL